MLPRDKIGLAINLSDGPISPAHHSEVSVRLKIYIHLHYLEFRTSSLNHVGFYLCTLPNGRSLRALVFISSMTSCGRSGLIRKATLTEAAMAHFHLSLIDLC